MDYKDKYNMYKYKFFNLRRQFEEQVSLKGGTNKYKIGDVKQFDGSGETKSVEIKIGNELAGYVVCSPFYFYGSFRPIITHYNDLELCAF